MTHSEDTDLRDAFAGQREENARVTPGFAETLVAARARPRPLPGWLPLAAAAAVLVLAGTGVWATWSLWHPRATTIIAQGSPVAIDLRLSQWVAPTDFLLDTPGSVLLRTVPTLYPATPLSPPSNTNDDTLGGNPT